MASLSHSVLQRRASMVISIAMLPSSAIMFAASMLLHLIASKVNYMRRSGITCRHAGRYTIMGQPQPGCFNWWHAGHTTYYTQIITWYWGHTIHITPCKNKLGVERILLKGYEAALRENTDRIYEIAMKILSDWSNQADSGPFIMSQFSLGQSHWPWRLVHRRRPQHMT